MICKSRIVLLLSLLVLMTAALGGSAKAQEVEAIVPKPVTVWDTLYKHTVKINPFAWFHPTVFYEYNIHRRHAAEVSLGGAPQMDLMGGVHHVGVAMGAVHYRFYFAKLWGMLFFLQAGGDLLYASGKYDVFDGSDGWDIRTRQFHYRRLLASPDFGFGIRFLSKKRFTAEFVEYIPLSRKWHQDDGDRLMDDAQLIFGLTQMISFKIGWSF